MATVRVFIEGTQRGYMVGTEDAAGVIHQVHYTDDGTTAGIAQIYKDASSLANSLQYELKTRKFSDLKRGGWIR
jgi:hypothetical protein